MMILIADDDRLSRFQLKSMLCELEADDLMFCEAANGKTMVEQCHILRPDIAFVDIEMPKMDGLSAIEECRRCCADMQFVIITGHSDFDFARRSISLQVADYLLKPIEPVRLKALMDDLHRRFLKTRRNLNMEYCVQVAQNLQLWEEIGVYETSDPCSGLDGCYFSYYFYIDYPPDVDEYRQSYQTLTESLRNITEKLTIQCIRSMVWEPKHAGLDFLAFGTDSQADQIEIHIRSLLDHFPWNRVCVTCMKRSAPNLRALLMARKDDEALASLRFAAKNGICAVEGLHLPLQTQNLLEILDNLVSTFHQADGYQYDKALDRLQTVGDDAVKPIDSDRLVKLLGICMGGNIRWDGNLHSLMRQLRAHKAAMFSGNAFAKTDKISTAVSYIEQHYMEDISVIHLADKLQVTPNYFSKVFHEQTGQTFSTYITQVRIEHAKQILLTRPDVKVRDVAIMVGYYSARHFSSVFQKLTGRFPSDFRDQAGVEETKDLQ